jgi:hypothetical protein
MGNRTTTSHLSRWGWLRALLLFSLALLLFAPSARAAETPAYQNTVEWGRLVRLWHELLDHSSGAAYDPARFREAAPDLDRADGDLAALVARKLLSAEIGEGLRGLFHARYQYVRERCYPTSARSAQTSTEALRAASCWVVELQISLLRQQSRLGSPDRKLLAAVEANLTTELSFQRGLDNMEAEQQRQREALLKQADGKSEQVDWSKFNLAAGKQFEQLVQAYQTRSLPRDRTTPRLIPYLFALTQATPSARTSSHLSDL